MTVPRNEGGYRDSRVPRIVRVGCAASALLVVLIMVLGASGSSVTVSNSSIVPPYSGATKSVYFSNRTTGCGALPTLGPHSLNLTTGQIQFRAKAVAPNCTGYRTASTLLQYTIHIPVTPTSSNTSVLLNWTVISNISAYLVLGKCKLIGAPPGPSCQQEAAATIGISTWLQDLGSRTSTYGTTWSAGFSYDRLKPCRPPSCTSPGHSGAGSVRVDQYVSLWINATGLDLAHHFDVDVLFTINVDAAFGGNSSTITGGHANANVNLQTKGNGAWLNSISLQ